jgi:uridylate kinase
MPNHLQVACVKLSGERLATTDKDESSGAGRGIDEAALDATAGEFVSALELHPDYRFVIGLGGGNFWRGRNSTRVSSKVTHLVGRLSTVFNTLFLADAFERQGVEVERILAPTMRVEDELADPDFRPYSPKAIHEAHKRGKVAILGAGLGIPGDTSDSGTVRAAVEYRQYWQQDEVVGCADVEVIKLTNYDGLYVSDPSKAVVCPEDGSIDPDLRRYKYISAARVIENYKALGGVDLTSLGLMTEHAMPMHIVGTAQWLPDVIKHPSQEAAVEAGIGTLIMPHAVEAVFH